MFKLNVLTPERKAVFDIDVTEVSVPAYSGEMTFLPGHAPFITTLGTGILKYKVKGQEKAFKAVLSWGYCEVVPQGVNVLAEFIQTPEEVVVENSQKQIQMTEKKLVSEILSDEDYKFQMNELEKAKAAVNLVKY